MSLDQVLVLALLALVPAVILSLLATSEVLEYPLFSTLEKVFWFLLLWLLPYAGVLVAHRRLGLGWGSGKDSGGGDTINVTDGGHGGGGDGGHSAL